MEKRNIVPVLGSLFTLGLITKKIRTHKYLNGKVVLITGGSKGLGLELATQLLKENCKIAICSRDDQELQEAKDYLENFGSEIFYAVCDVGDKRQVESFVSDVTKKFHQIDIVINNAGIIMVGALESYTEKEFRKAMDVMYWGMVHTTLAVLPQMKARGSGHIVNITSVGGKVSIPHLMAYSASKFAAVGLSEGLAAELKKDNIHVTTIVPGLMRTGSYVNALYQEGNTNAFKLFSAISSAPLITVSAQKAARKVITAIKDKRSLKVIGFPAKALIEFHHFFPETTIRIFGLVSKFLPSSTECQVFEKGENILRNNEDAEVPVFRAIGHKAQREHQLKNLH